MPDAHTTLLAAHTALRAFNSGSRDRLLGQAFVNLTAIHDSGTLKFSDDTYAALVDAEATIYAEVAGDVEDLLAVLLDDAGLGSFDLEPAGSPEEFDGWHCPVYVTLMDDDFEPTDVQAYCDLYAAPAAEQADYLFSELVQGA